MEKLVNFWTERKPFICDVVQGSKMTMPQLKQGKAGNPQVRMDSRFPH